MAIKFTKEDIHAKFLSDDIDTAVFRRLDKVGLDLICVVLANRLGEALNASAKTLKLKAHCIAIIDQKCQDKRE
jgi:hypothetical protein